MTNNSLLKLLSRRALNNSLYRTRTRSSICTCMNKNSLSSNRIISSHDRFSSSSSSSNEASSLPNTAAIATTTSSSQNQINNYLPINFDISSSIQGEESQILTVQLYPNQVLRAESGAMIYMSEGIEMSTTLGTNSTTSSTTLDALSQGMKRYLTGQNLFLSDYTYTGSNPTKGGTVALGTDFPSKIIQLDLTQYPNHTLICQKGAYLASSLNITLELEFTKKFTTGFFGGEGFILQKLTGLGTVFLKAGGTLVKRELQAGETLRISSGCLVAFTSGVEYDVQTVTGFKNVMFGGEGLFITTLTGPGTVWLQGQPPDRMISEIARRVPSGGGIGLGIPIGMGGGGGTDAGGTEQGESGVIDASNPSGNDNEDLVAATDSAVNMDRNATVASTLPTTDSESPSALFGDAASKEDTTTSSSDLSATESNDFTSFSNTVGNDYPSSSSSSSSSQDFFESEKDIMMDDKQQFDNFVEDETSFSTEQNSADGAETSSGEEGGGIGDLFRDIWDFFNDDD